MKSFSSRRAADMDRWLCFSLLLASLPAAELWAQGDGCLSQPGVVVWRKTGHAVVLPCDVSPRCSAQGLRYEWFAFKRDVHYRLDLESSPLKYRLDGASLHIKSLNASDSGIYYCAAASGAEPAPGAQYVGNGTTLQVKGVHKTMVRNILLWVIFVLLALYSVAIVTLIILKKYGCNTHKRMHASGKKHSTRKTQFRDVLQEMYHRRNLGKQTVSRNPSQDEAACGEFRCSDDDIYQNV